MLAAGRATLSLTRCVICRLLHSVEISSRRHHIFGKSPDGGLGRLLRSVEISSRRLRKSLDGGLNR